jgi:hypothetical protein
MAPNPVSALPVLRLDAPAPEPRAAVLVARGAGHDTVSLRAAEAAGAMAGAAVRCAHSRIEVGPPRWGSTPHRSLGDLLAEASPSTGLMLDLRGVDPRLPRTLLRELAGSGRQTVIACSRSWWLLEPLRGHLPVLHTVMTGRQLNVLLRRCDTTRLDGVVVHRRLLTPSRVTALRAMADSVYAWPADSASDARRLLEWGVTGLIAERVEHLPGAVSNTPLAA